MTVLTEFHQNTTSTLNECFEILWNIGLINSHILLQEDTNIWSLYTFMPYQHDCSTLTHIKFVSFTSSNFTRIAFSLDQLYPEKLNNFNQCPLNVAASIANPLLFPRNLSDPNNPYKGIDVDIITQISKSLNFTIVFKRSLDGRGMIFSNGSVTGNMDLVSRRKMCFIFALIEV